MNTLCWKKIVPSAISVSLQNAAVIFRERISTFSLFPCKKSRKLQDKEHVRTSSTQYLNQQIQALNWFLYTTQKYSPKYLFNAYVIHIVSLNTSLEISCSKGRLKRRNWTKIGEQRCKCCKKKKKYVLKYNIERLTLPNSNLKWIQVEQSNNSSKTCGLLRELLVRKLLRSQDFEEILGF